MYLSENEKRVLRGLLLIETERLAKKSCYFPNGLSYSEQRLYTTYLDLYKKLDY